MECKICFWYKVKKKKKLGLQNLTLVQSHEEEIELLTKRIQNLSLTQSQEEEIKYITCHLRKLSLTQSQEEIEKEDEYEYEMNWSYDSSMFGAMILNINNNKRK